MTLCYDLTYKCLQWIKFIKSHLAFRQFDTFCMLNVIFELENEECHILWVLRFGTEWKVTQSIVNNSERKAGTDEEGEAETSACVSVKAQPSVTRFCRLQHIPASTCVGARLCVHLFACVSGRVRPRALVALGWPLSGKTPVWFPGLRRAESWPTSQQRSHVMLRHKRPPLQWTQQT